MSIKPVKTNDGLNLNRPLFETNDKVQDAYRISFESKLNLESFIASNVKALISKEVAKIIEAENIDTSVDILSFGVTYTCINFHFGDDIITGSIPDKTDELWSVCRETV